MNNTSLVQARVDNSLKEDLPLTPNDRLAKLLAGRPRVRLETDENGYAVVDKEKHSRLYEWAVKG